MLSLRQLQEEETGQPFGEFMIGQLKKSLALEISNKLFDISKAYKG